MNKPIVLIVDDQANLRKLLRLSLCQEYDVIEAEDGAGALKLVREHRPQVVILDVMMPGEFDGIEVCRQIKKDPALAHTGVVMVTARGQASDIESGMAVGADAYFPKPFSPLKLLAFLREHYR